MPKDYSSHVAKGAAIAKTRPSIAGEWHQTADVDRRTAVPTAAETHDVPENRVAWERIFASTRSDQIHRIVSHQPSFRANSIRRKPAATTSVQLADVMSDSTRPHELAIVVDARV